MSTGNFQEDSALISAAQRGSLDAFNALVERYQDNIYTVAYRILGERESAADAAQNAFLTAYRSLSTYRGGSFRGWLSRIVTNLCYDDLRRHKRRPAIGMDDLAGEESDDGPPLPDPAPTPEQAAQERELQRAIQACIGALGSDQRVTLVMSDVEGFSYNEIAASTGATLGTVKSRLARARAAVRDCLRAVEELLPPAYRLTNNES
jgi:RNA polymerase sigma-70 factor (ECF subfamily)